MAEESKSLWSKLAEQATDVVGDVAKIWATGTFDGDAKKYQTYQGGQGTTAPAGTSTTGLSVMGQKISPLVLIGGAAALVGLFIILK